MLGRPFQLSSFVKAVSLLSVMFWKRALVWLCRVLYIFDTLEYFAQGSYLQMVAFTIGLWMQARLVIQCVCDNFPVQRRQVAISPTPFII